MAFDFVAEANKRQRKPHWRKGWGEPCASCGWAKRYHTGMKGEGALVFAPEQCSGFVPSIKHAPKPQRVEVEPEHVLYVPPVAFEIPLYEIAASV